MRYCTTQGTSAVFRSPVIIVSVSSGSRSPWINIARVARGKAELQLQQPLRRHEDDFVDVRNGVGQPRLERARVGAEAHLHPDGVRRDGDEAEEQREERDDDADQADDAEDEAQGIDVQRPTACWANAG